MDQLITKGMEIIQNAEKILVFTGAGLSTDSGIPDFRSPGGIWDRYDPSDFYFQKIISDEKSRERYWQMSTEYYLVMRDALPNPAHLAIKAIEDAGKLLAIVTQNIDNLHQKAGVPDDMVFELHGNMRWARCLECDRRFPFQEIRQRLEQGEEIPDCPDCRGMLKPDIVMFEEQLPVDVLQESAWRAQEADVCIVIGSTLTVYPAALMPQYAVRSGAELAIINLTDTPLDHEASVVIHAKAGETMAAIAQKVKEKSRLSGL